MLINIQKKLARNARLPASPLQSPRTPCDRIIFLVQSIGPWNSRADLRF
jgi:hypothetical protein